MRGAPYCSINKALIFGVEVWGVKVVVHPVNPGFRSYVEQYVSEIEEPRYTLVETKGYGGATFVYDCTSDNPWTAVDCLKAALRRPPIGNAMFCQVTPEGMLTWPPLFDKDKYPRP